MRLLLLLLCSATAFATDSVVVFNEIMYHPAAEEDRWEWIELHNQLVVDVDLSDWRITDGIEYIFPAGTVIPAEGYLVVALSPADLATAVPEAILRGPFEGRLSNSGERLQLRNNSGRIMDEIEYADQEPWPVAPDGSGVSLAKLYADRAGPSPENWTWSRQIGGTPGQANFPPALSPVRVPLIALYDTWTFRDAASPPEAGWPDPGFADTSWRTAPAGFYAGVPAVSAEPATIPTLFSTGLDEDGEPLSPGQIDPHYTNAATGDPLLVMQNHSAWLANNAQSLWVGLSGNGTDNFPAGSYTFRTTFDLTGFDPATTQLTCRIAVDDELSAMAVNGAATGITASGFSGWSGPFTLDSGFQEGVNTLDFTFVNGGSSPNPSGLRVALSGMAAPHPGRTAMSAETPACFFRKAFDYLPDPSASVSLYLRTWVADGAVFYLNGEPVYRQNMPDGAIDFTTPALKDIVETGLTETIPIPVDALVSGRNVLAVEVHHAADSDALFFASELTAVESPVPLNLPQDIAINEISPASGNPFQVELMNDGGTVINLTGLVLACRGAVDAEYTLPAGSLPPGDFLAFDASVLGFHPADEDKLFLYAPGGAGVIDAAVVKNSHRGRLPDGTGDWAYPAEPTFGAANRFAIHDEIVINEIMYHDSPIPESPAEIATETLISSGAQAAVLVPQDESLDLTWTGKVEPFDDSSWNDGQGDTTGLGYETTPADFAGLIATDLLDEMYQKQTSVYIRIPFTVTDPDQIDVLTLAMKYDDGFVAWINGVEVAHKYAPGRDGDTQPLDWRSHSTASHADDRAVIFEEFDITPSRSHLRPGRNILAIQGLNWSEGSTDMLILPELYARRLVRPYTPFQESPQEWIELYNRSDQTVSLARWKIRGGIEYEFEPDATIPGGGYLVVARDARMLRAAYPDIEIVGDFDNRLSNSTESVLLVEPSGNVADEVEYFDRGYWPTYADAGGCTLELQDPFADNASPLAWACSDQTARSAWRTYSYRAVASPTPGGNEPSLWNEFVFGLLDAGEILIDDIRVIDDPAASAVSLLQNGSFESGLTSWRLLGNHAFGAVIPDPQNPGNHVLHLRATGPTEHMHNHVETTLAGNRSIVNGREYEISFRAKWLAGSNQLNTRLYFNRAPRTTLLERPVHRGTPGRANSRQVVNLGPTFHDLIHTPAVPDAGEPVTVTVHVGDPDGVADVTLFSSTDSGPFTSHPMLLTDEDRYEAVLNSPASGSVVQFYAQAVDAAGKVSVWPPAGADSRALFTVNDGQAGPGSARNFRIVMTPSDAAFLHQSTNVMSNHRMPATVIDREDTVYYDVGIHLKGSGYGRNNDRAGFNIRFRPDQLYRGVHDTVSVDRNGGPSGSGASQRELVVKHIGNRAGDVPGMMDDVVYLISPRGDLNGPAQLLMARYDDAFLDAQYANGGDGTLYEFELIYYSQSTVDGDPESLKQPPSNVLPVDFRDMGDDKESYRWNYLIKNNRAADDFSRIMEMAQAFSADTQTLSATIDGLIDVDEWMRVFAFQSLCGIGDTYNQGLAHNLMLYLRPEDQRVLAMPWDLDFAFHQSPDAPIFGYGSQLQRVIALDAYRRLFYGHLHDIINTAFDPDYLESWIRHYGEATGQNADADILERIRNRRSFVLANLPAAVPFAITTNAGNPFTVDDDTVLIRGNAWIDVHRIHLAGHPDPLVLQWTDLDSWQATIPLEPGENPLAFEARGHRGELLASDTVHVFSTVAERPLRDHLRISELMVDPSGGKEYEYIEFLNTGPDALDLTHVAIAGGIQFQFAGSTFTSLAPDQYVVVAADLDAFRSRYGEDIPVAGQFDGALDNNGETIRILGRYGSSVLTFTYDDNRSWPLAAQGAGHALVPLEQAIARQPDGSLDYGGNWRAGSFIHGSPGQPDPRIPQSLVLNEIMAHTDYPVPPHDSNDWIEICNAGEDPVQLDHRWYLSDSLEEPRKWPLPAMTIQPGGRVTFDEVTGFHNPITTGFGLNKAGDQVVLSFLPGTPQDRIVDCIAFEGQEETASVGRFPDGEGPWHTMPPTRDWPNAEPFFDVILSEIMYDPAYSTGAGDYIELYNTTDAPILLQNAAGPWRLRGDVDLDLPPGITLPPYGRIVLVGFDPVAQPASLAAFQQKYESEWVSDTVLLGPWQGTLPDRVGRISLQRPMSADIPGDDTAWVIADETTYFAGPPWPVPSAPDQVLQRRSPVRTAGEPGSWRTAAASPAGRSISAADFDADARVDASDLTALSQAWLSQPGAPSWNPALDLADENDLIDLNDLTFFIQQWLSHRNAAP